MYLTNSSALTTYPQTQTKRFSAVQSRVFYC